MEKHCGLLERVGNMTGGEFVTPVDDRGNEKWIGSFRVATGIDAIQIGKTLLKKPRCEEDLAQNLSPGREACLYICRIGLTPVLLGVKYADGAKHLITKSYLRGSILQLLTVFSLMYGIGGLIAGGIIGSLIGIDEYGVGIGGLAAVGWCWWSAYQFWTAYQEAKAD